MGKNNRKATINNIENLNIEIDYKKLADAIVEANNNSKVKDMKHSKVRCTIMNWLNGIVYSIIYILSFYGVYYVWHNNLLASLVAKILFSVFFAVLGISMLLSQQESIKESFEESREHFNTNISLIALIVALIALYKGFN